MYRKACGKCGGDLLVDPDPRDRQPDLVCLQCGYRVRGRERESDESVQALLGQLSSSVKQQSVQ
jgi:hypothetical protein